MLSAVSWDGGGDGVNWSDPINWSGNALPGAADDVTISVAGPITVTHASGNTTVRSVTSDENLVISGGSFTVTDGTSVVNGNFTVSTASLTATGATTSFTASGPATIDFSNLFATAGAQLNLTSATTYAERPSSVTTIQTFGSGSKIDLSGLTSITGDTGGLRINALKAGQVELDGLTTLTARDVDVRETNAASIVDLSALSSWTDATSLSSIEVNEGKVQLGSSTILTGVFVTANSLGTLAGGNVQLNAPGSLTGEGTIQANFTNNANVAPGPFHGKLNFIGNYSQTTTGALSVELNGLVPSSGYDQIAVQGAVTLDGTLAITRGFTPAIGDSFTIIDNDGVDAVIGTFFDSPEGDIYTIDTIPFRLSYLGGDGNDVTLTRVDNTVVGRLLFYNQSGSPTRYDGNDVAINAADDLAIATDKTAYQWEDAGAATFANVSSYTKGINGIMVDLAGPHGSVSAADFIFRIGNNNSPGLWDLANAPASISVRAGAGRKGSDRIEIIWTSGAPANQWLEVITLANAATGLPQKVGHPLSHADAFFYGSAVGNAGAGDSTNNSLVNSLDEAGIRANPALLASNIPITNVYDVNRNGAVNSTDESAVRLNGTNPATATRYLNLTTAPAAPESGDVSDAGVASALAAPALTNADGGAPKWLTNRLDNIDLNSGSPAKLFQYLHDTNSPRSRALLQKFDSVADVLGLDDTLLESLLADLGSA